MITINQLAADDEILTLKSSDVDHPMTAVTETDTYLSVRKTSGASGGVTLEGFCDGANVGAELRGSVETEITTTTSSSQAAVLLKGQKSDGGTGVSNIGTTGNIVAMRDGSNTRWLIQGNGDVHQTTDAHTTLDEWDDVQLCRAWDLDRSPQTVIKDEWDEFVTYRRKELIEAGFHRLPQAD